MRTYKLITGNRALADSLSERTVSGDGWRLMADVDDDVADNEAMVLTPEGEKLYRGRLGPNTMPDVKRQIGLDMTGRPKPPVTATLTRPAERPQYRGTTGDERAAQILSTYQHEDWMLTVAHMARAETDHVQILLGNEVVGNVPTLPRNTIVGLATQLIKRHHAKRQAPAAQVPPIEQVAAAAQPAKPAPPSAAENVRSARQVGRAMQEASPVANGPGETLREIQIRDIQHFPGGNVREVFQGIDELAASIRQLGVIQPLTVNEADGRYTLVAGERRLRAAGQAGLTTVPCRVMRWTEQQALEAMLVENIQREDLNSIEEARAYQRLLKVLGSRERVADRVGMSRVHVTEYLQLLELPPDVQHQVATGIMPVKSGLDFLRRTREATEPVKQKVAEALKQEQPSVRQAPAVIDRVLKQEGVARATPPKQPPASAKTAASSTPEPQPFTTQRAPSALPPAPAPAQPPAPGSEPEAAPLMVSSAVLARFDELRSGEDASEFLAALMDYWEGKNSR